MKLLGAILGLCLFLLPALARAEDLPPPTRESLIATWEKAVAADSHTTVFKKAGKDGVYLFETDFFPYQGRLKLLNAAVVKYEDEDYENLWRGILEIELLDAPDDFTNKYSRSYAAWQQGNNFYYNARKGKWFSADAWNDNAADFDKYAAASAAKAACAPPDFWRRYGGELAPLGGAAAFIGLLLLFARRQNKRVWANHAKALEEQQRGLRMVEESLKHQEIHTQILKDILSALRK